MAMTEEQFNKLPKWAQAEFRAARRTIQDLQGIIDRINGPEDAHITASQGHGRGTNDQRIDAPYGVDFKLGDMGSINVRRVEEKGQQMLRLMATGHPTQLTIIPQVTNVVNVGLIK